MDATTNHYDLTMYGNVVLTNTPYWMKSPSGYVARCSNAGDNLFAYISRTQLLAAVGGKLTIEAHLYPRAYKGDGVGIVSIWGQYSSPNFAQFGLYYSTGLIPATPQIWANCCAFLDNNTWSTYAAPNSWHSLKITFDGATSLTCAYIDGILRGTSTNPAAYPIATDWQLTLGNFDGDIDEVRISNSVR